MISDMDISRLLGISISTINTWKKKDSSKHKLYLFLKSFKKEDVEKRLSIIEE
jgi:hypothetical protein